MTMATKYYWLIEIKLDGYGYIGRTSHDDARSIYVTGCDQSVLTFRMLKVFQIERFTETCT